MKAILLLCLLPTTWHCDECANYHSDVRAVKIVQRQREAELVYNEQSQELERTYRPAHKGYLCSLHAGWGSFTDTLPPGELDREFNERLCRMLGVEYVPCK